MLALAMAVAPVLATAGEMHGFEHASEAAADHHGSYEDVHPDQSAEGDPEGDALHVLAHASHCCAQAVAVLTAMPLLQLMDPPANAMSSPPSIRPPGVSANHFRPPIAA